MPISIPGKGCCCYVHASSCWAKEQWWQTALWSFETKSKARELKNKIRKISNIYCIKFIRQKIIKTIFIYNGIKPKCGCVLWDHSNIGQWTWPQNWISWIVEENEKICLVRVKRVKRSLPFTSSNYYYVFVAAGRYFFSDTLKTRKFSNRQIF